MTKKIIFIIATIFGAIASYGTFSLLFWDGNPGNWGWFGRLVAFIFLVIYAANWETIITKFIYKGGRKNPFWND